MTFSAFAPGRVELLGNHTDYNDGVVLSAALDLGISVEGGIRNDGKISVRSEGMQPVSASVGRLEPTGEWSDYPLGVTKILQSAGWDISGFEASYRSTLPLGAGLSSSAAMEVATAVLLTKMFPKPVTPLDLAKLCRRSENEFVGVNCGLLDQVSSIFGRAGHAIYLDCRSETVETVPFPNGAALVIVNSAVKHALTGGEYNERREMCFEAARAIGVPALRDATEHSLAAADMPPLVRRRAAHIIGENDRVTRALGFLRSGDAAGFGQLMTASHKSSMENFENSTPELDALVRIANSVKGIFGARLTGGGFGGAIVALAEESRAEEAASEIAGLYHVETGYDGKALVCHPGRGAWEANDMSSQTRSP